MDQRALVDVDRLFVCFSSGTLEDFLNKKAVCLPALGNKSAYFFVREIWIMGF